MNKSNGGEHSHSHNRPGTFTLLRSLHRFKACGKKVTTNNNGGGNQLENGNQTKQKKKRRMEDGKLNPKTVEMLRKKTKFSK